MYACRLVHVSISLFLPFAICTYLSIHKYVHTSTCTMYKHVCTCLHVGELDWLPGPDDGVEDTFTPFMATVCFAGVCALYLRQDICRAVYVRCKRSMNQC